MVKIVCYWLFPAGTIVFLSFLFQYIEYIMWQGNMSQRTFCLQSHLDGINLLTTFFALCEEVISDSGSVLGDLTSRLKVNSKPVRLKPFSSSCF